MERKTNPGCGKTLFFFFTATFSHSISKITLPYEQKKGEGDCKDLRFVYLKDKAKKQTKFSNDIIKPREQLHRYLETALGKFGVCLDFAFLVDFSLIFDKVLRV